MNGGGRSNLQPPNVSDYPPARPTLPPPFTVGLREAGPVGELVYFTIRQAAKNAWLLQHAEDYEGPVMQGRVRDYIGDAEET